jgi:Flp pilus assembly protein protease CpaA
MSNAIHNLNLLIIGHDVLMAIFLLCCAWLDVKTRQVPNLLTLPVLVYGMILAGIRGNWPAALLVVAYVLLSDPSKISPSLTLTLSLLLLGIAGVASWHSLGLGMDAILVQVVIFIIWQLWVRGLTGGADAKLMMALALIYGSGAFLAATLVGGLFGLGALLLKKRTLPYVLPIAAGTIAFMLLRLTTQAIN